MTSFSTYIEERRKFLGASKDSKNRGPHRDDRLEGTGNVGAHQIHSNNVEKLYMFA